MIRAHLCVALLLGLPGAALGNDTMASLGVGGLEFLVSDKIEMAREDLYVSMDEVRVRYEFRNVSDEDETALVAFPMPDITGSPDFMVNLPTENSDNVFDFETLLDGEPVNAELHQYVFAANIDQTKLLRQLGVPLAPFSQATRAALGELDEGELAELAHRGMIVPLDFDQGQGWEREFYPVWTLKSTYSWEAHFPAGETVVVEHRYKPSVGGTVGVTFLVEPFEDYDPAADYARRYCTDEAFLNAVRRTLKDGDPYSAPFTEFWLSYIWSTGANWAGPIKQFRLVVDKGRPENLVSFCGEGVKKIGPTSFEMVREDFWPSNSELDVLILNRQTD